MNKPGLRPFTHVSPTTIVYGEGCREDTGRVAAELGIERLVLMCSARFAGSALGAGLVESLGDRLAGVFSDVVPHSNPGLVEHAATVARRLDVDGIVAVGGGSVIDSAKFVTVLLGERRPLAELLVRYTPEDGLHRPVLPAVKLPIIALPTTTGAAAEVNASAGIADYDEGSKIAIYDPKAMPKVALLDPILAAGMPPRVTAGTGANSFAHCVEAVYSRAGQPVTRALALEAARMLYESLPVCVAEPSNLDARGTAQVASAMSGIALSNSMVGLHHAMCHPLGVIAGASHGDSNAVMLPHSLRFNAPAVADELAAVGRALGLATPAAGDPEPVVAAIDEFLRQLGAPSRLRELGVDRSDLPAIAAVASRDHCIAFNPRPVTAEEIVGILERAW